MRDSVEAKIHFPAARALLDGRNDERMLRFCSARADGFVGRQAGNTNGNVDEGTSAFIRVRVVQLKGRFQVESFSFQNVTRNAQTLTVNFKQRLLFVSPPIVICQLILQD